MTELFHTQCTPEEISAAASVLQGGKLVMASQVAALEEELAAYFERPKVITCGSGTDALILALEPFVETGDEVIIPAMTFSATAEAVIAVRGKPVVADCSAQLTPSRDHLAALITWKTKAVVIVHLHGWPAPEIKAIAALCHEKGIHLIEDCAQAFGAEIDGKKVGMFGAAAAFSFYPTKPLGGIGDGGMVMFNSRPFATLRAAARRNNGRDAMGRQFIAGFNSRLDEVNAAVLRLRLRNYEQTVLKLRGFAKRYEQQLVAQPIHYDSGWPAPYVYPISLANRTGMMQHLQRHEIQTGVHYPIALSRMPYILSNECAVAESLAERLLSLPCHQNMTYGEIDLICSLIRNFQSLPAKVTYAR